MGNTESPGALFPRPKSSLRSGALFPCPKSSLRSSALFSPLKIKSATWRIFSPAQNPKLRLLFGNKQISSPHYHEIHFYTILKYFKRLKKNHTNIITNTHPP